MAGARAIVRQVMAVAGLIGIIVNRPREPRGVSRPAARTGGPVPSWEDRLLATGSSTEGRSRGLAFVLEKGGQREPKTGEEGLGLEVVPAREDADARRRFVVVYEVFVGKHDPDPCTPAWKYSRILATTS